MISPCRDGSGLPLSSTPGRTVAMTGLFSGQTIFTIMFPRQPGTTITSLIPALDCLDVQIGAVGRKPRPEPCRHGGCQICTDGGASHENDVGAGLSDETAENLRAGIRLVKAQPGILDDEDAACTVGDQLGSALTALFPDDSGRDLSLQNRREVQGLLQDFERSTCRPAVPLFSPDENFFHTIPFFISHPFFTMLLPRLFTVSKCIHLPEPTEEYPCSCLRFSSDHFHVPFLM